MKLTKMQVKILEAIESHLKRAEEYLQRDDVVGIAVKCHSPNGASFIMQNPACAAETSHHVTAVEVVNKNIGSDLTGLYTGRKLLSEFLKS